MSKFEEASRSPGGYEILDLDVVIPGVSDLVENLPPDLSKLFADLLPPLKVKLPNPALLNEMTSTIVGMKFLTPSEGSARHQFLEVGQFRLQLRIGIDSVSIRVQLKEQSVVQNEFLATESLPIALQDVSSREQVSADRYPEALYFFDLRPGCQYVVVEDSPTSSTNKS